MAKFMAMIEEKFSGYYKRFDEINERLERMAKTRSAAQAEVLEETSTQRHGASKVGVTQNTPQTGTRMLQGKGRQAQTVMKRIKIKHKLLGLAIATRRDWSPVVSPFGEGLLEIQHP